MTAMKHARFIAATVLAALLLAGCTGRRTAGDAADKASADDGTSETAVSTPEPTGEETPAGERSTAKPPGHHMMLRSAMLSNSLSATTNARFALKKSASMRSKKMRQKCIKFYNFKP
mgnify:CR=1 FL=1